MKYLKVISKNINRLNNLIGLLLKFVPLFILFLLLIGMIARYVFNSPIAWETEILAYVFNSMFIIAGGYVLLNDGIIRMDVFYQKLSAKSKAMMDVLTFSLVALYLIPLIIKGFEYAYKSYLSNERYISAVATPLYPYKYLITVGFVIMLLQEIANFIDNIDFIIHKKS